MSRSIKFKNNIFLDASGITFKRNTLYKVLNEMLFRKDYYISGTAPSGVAYQGILEVPNVNPERRSFGVVMCTIKYNTNANGDRGLCIYSIDQNGNVGNGGSPLTHSNCRACSGNSTRLCIIYPVHWSIKEKLSIQTFQNSGSELNYECVCKVLYIDPLANT